MFLCPSSVTTLFILFSSIICGHAYNISDGISAVGEKKEGVSGRITLDNMSFDYMSTNNEFQQEVTFVLDNTEIGRDIGEWIGMRLKSKNISTIDIDLVNKYGKVKVISVKKDEEIDEQGKATLYAMSASELGGFLVMASVKLGGEGNIGSDNKSWLAFHHFARWVYDLSVSKENINILQWDLKEVDISVEQANNEIDYQLAIDSSFKPDTAMHLTRNLGLNTCEIEDKCDNACFGMCGNGCNCWRWYCGTCDCVQDCYDHDYYCSCKGMLSFWCVNGFWVDCD